MERRFGWLAFPGFLRYYALFHVMVYGLQIFNPRIGEVLEFDRAKILGGEVWRLVTFLFASSGMGGVGGLGIIFLFFMVLIAFLMSDSLEGAWGVFRTSMFHYFGIVGLILGNFLVHSPGSGFLLYQAAFFAFATLFPRVEFRLFLILPVQVRFLAILAAAITVLAALRQPPLLLLFLPAFANYILWAGIPALRGTARVASSAKRRRKFNAKKLPEDEPFHRCMVCHRTDRSDPTLEFRVGSDGREYCEEHKTEIDAAEETR